MILGFDGVRLVGWWMVNDERRGKGIGRKSHAHELVSSADFLA